MSLEPFYRTFFLDTAKFYYTWFTLSSTGIILKHILGHFLKGQAFFSLISHPGAVLDI